MAMTPGKFDDLVDKRVQANIKTRYREFKAACDKAARNLWPGTSNDTLWGREAQQKLYALLKHSWVGTWPDGLLEYERKRVSSDLLATLDAMQQTLAMPSLKEGEPVFGEAPDDSQADTPEAGPAHILKE